MDSGFSWVILLASTFNFTLYAGIIRTFGVLYAELLQQNEDASSKIAFVSSLQIFISAVAAMVSGQTSIHFSFKWTTVIGGIIAAVGMATSSFVIHNGYLYLTYSLILGSGLGMMHNSSSTIINFYFEKKRAFANGVFATGVGISSLFFPTLYRTLFDEYGIRGALLILGGILLNICVAGFAFRQPKQFQNKINAPGKNEEKIKSSHTIETTINVKSNINRLNLFNIKEHILKTFKVYKTVWTNKSIFLYFLSFSFVLVGNSGLILVLPSYLESENYLKGDVIKLLTVYGTSDLAARYLLGLLIDRQWLPVQTFYSLFMILGGVLCIGILYVKSLPMFYVIMIMFSTFPGAHFQCRPLLFVNVCQLEDLPSVFALQKLVSDTTVMIMFPVLASTFNFTLYAGILRTFGVLYAELLQQYEDAAGKLAFASSLQIFMSAVAGMISGQTSIHFSFKWTTVIGGIIAAVGMATSSLAIHNWYLYLTYSLILGSGLGIMHTSGTTIINFYFEKKRALANGIFASGAGLSSLFFPTLYRKLFDKYGLRGGLLIVGGILLNICVAGFAFRQPLQFHKRTNLLGKDEAREECSSNNESHQKLNKTLLKLTKIKHHLMKTLKVYKTVWTNKSFFLYFISFSFALVGNGGYLMILPSFLEGIQFSKEDVVIMLTVFGATDLVTRCPFGLMFDRKWLSVQTFYSAFMVIGGVVCIVMIHTDTLSMHYVLLILFSTFPGAIFHFRPLLIVNVGQLEDFPSVFALLNLVSNTAVLIALPILGMLEDLTGSWDASLYACSALLFLAAILVILERILFGTNNRSSKTTDQEEESLD